MTNYIGIDLGTTFSAVAVLDDTGRPTIVHNRDGQNITPSCVYVDGDAVVVGEDARKAWDIEPAKVAARFKRDMGSAKRFSVDGRQFSAMDLSCLVLTKLKLDTEATIGSIAEAVVTIPANFTNEAREETLGAAKQAGLNIKYIVNEPTAAALYYAYKMGQELHGTYAVYDFGGGTFDVSIIKVEGQDIEVVTSHGVARLGGDDFDRALQEVVSRKYKKVTGKDLPLGQFSKNAAEDVKRSLSKLQRKQVPVCGQVIEITREEFETEISSLIAQAEMLCEAALDEASIGAPSLSGVFLVGGTTRVPIVQESVRRVFGKEPISSVNVDEVVSLGAALYAAYKGDKKHLSTVQRTAVSAIKFSEVTNFCFGTIVQSLDELRNTRTLRNSVIIEKNTRIPCSVSAEYFTVHDGQEAVDCDVTQSVAPETDPRFVTIIWEGQMPLPPGRPKGQKIIVTYGFDANNVMSCSFKDAATGVDRVINLSIASKASSDGNLDKFLVE